MSMYSYAAIFITLAALISYVNHRFIRMQSTIAIMAAALLISAVLLILSMTGFPITHSQAAHFIEQVHFGPLVMHIMLGILLFAGALTINLTQLKAQKIEVMCLVTVSTIASAFLVAFLSYAVLNLIGVNLDFVYCMLFGSLISPTDPIAVLSIFKQLGTPKKLETIVSAESLFNDGVGVVLFVTTAKLAFAGVPATFPHIVGLFLREAAGGIVYGLIIGWLAHWLLKSINDSKVEILLTIAVVFGGYTFAQAIDISGPLAMVAAGIFIANYKRDEVVSRKDRQQMNHFWELIEELLNAVLFLLLGFELLVINFNVPLIIAAVCMIPSVLLIRYITVALPISILKPWRRHVPYTITILTWGGLRGGLAVALAMSIPDQAIRGQILTLTYAVVMFAILVQGTTITHYVKLANRFSEKRSEKK